MSLVEKRLEFRTNLTAGKAYCGLLLYRLQTATLQGSQDRHRLLCAIIELTDL